MGLNIPKNRKDAITKVDKYNYMVNKIYEIESGWNNRWQEQRSEALNYKMKKGKKYHDTTYRGVMVGSTKTSLITDETKKSIIKYYDSIKPKTPKKPLYKVNMADQREVKNIDMQEAPFKPGIEIDENKYSYNKYWDPKEKEYRVSVLDKSKKRKNMSTQTIDDISLDQFKLMYRK